MVVVIFTSSTTICALLNCWVNCSWVATYYWYNFEFEMGLLYIKGTCTRIKLVSPDKLNEGLGFCIVPDRNQKHECDHKVWKIKHICKAAKAMYLYQYKAFILRICCLTPQMTYVMRLSQLMCLRLCIVPNRNQKRGYACR